MTFSKILHSWRWRILEEGSFRRP